MNNSLRKSIIALDLWMEGLLLRSRSSAGSFSKPWQWFALAALPAAALLKYLTGPYNPFDLFVLALILCCVIFRYGGLLAIILAAALDLWVKALEIGRLGRPDLWPKFLLDSFFHCLEWILVCGFVIVTLEKWASLKALKQRTDDDLALAKSFQSSLSGKSCLLPRVQLHGSIHQCDAVGGDFYYFRPFGKKMLNFCVGDVMGKGISASLLMAMVMSFVYEWGKQSLDPSEIAGRLNRRFSHLWDGRKGSFITIFYGILDEEQGMLKYCAAGQKGAFLLRNKKLTDLVSDCDPPLGVVEPWSYTLQNLKLEPNDHLLFFTDGVYEAKSENGELFGTERLGEIFSKYAPLLDGETLLQTIENAVLRHTGGVYTDDTTLLSIHYLGGDDIHI